MDTDVLLSNVQSVLQLSVGTNITFAVLLSLFDTALDKHRRIALSMKEGVIGRINDDDTSKTEKDKLKPYIPRIDEKIKNIEGTSKRIEWIVAQRFQPLFLACAFISFVLLCYCVLRANDEAGVWIYALALVTFLPFMWFSVKSLFISFKLSSELRKLSEELT